MDIRRRNCNIVYLNFWENNLKSLKCIFSFALLHSNGCTLQECCQAYFALPLYSLSILISNEKNAYGNGTIQSLVFKQLIPFRISSSHMTLDLLIVVIPLSAYSHTNADL